MFIEKLDGLLKQKGVSANAMSTELGFGNSAYSHWKRRGNIPTGDILQKLCEYFNVSADYLLGIAPPTVFEKELSADEKELIAVYQLLDARGRARTLTVAYEEQDRASTQKTFKQDA